MSEHPERRCGLVGLAGAPNAGKSTLVNRLVGQKISITSRCPQTTRQRVCGILTEENSQVVFVDVPGILEPRDRFNQALVGCAADALAGCDLILHLRTAAQIGSEEEQQVVAILDRIGKPVWQVWNKIDLSKRFTEPAPAAGRYPVEGSYHVSARVGTGTAALKRDLLARVPPGEFLYPEDDLSDRDLRFLCPELVREKLFEFLREEVPYGTAAYVEDWNEREDGTLYLAVMIQTERESHKRMIVGAGGSMVKRIGTAARQEIEALTGSKVFLDLRVRVKAHWRKNQAELERLGLFGGE